MKTAIDLSFFQEDVGNMFGWASLGRWTTTDGGISICQVSLFYNNQYHDINISGGHDFVIISDIFFKYHDINMSGGHNFVIGSNITFFIMISICQVVTIL